MNLYSNSNFIFKDYDPNFHLTALGIGDLIFTFILLKNDLIKDNVYINLFYFSSNFWYPNPSNALEFRIRLFDLLCEKNNIDKKRIIFTYTTNKFLEQHLKFYKLIDKPSKWSLAPINTKNKFDFEYIVFHTKSRLSLSNDNQFIKNKLIELFINLKSKYKIVLLGERNFPETFEKKFHHIITIYDELQYLKNNNEVIDLTCDSIYNNLDLNNYIDDVNVISFAKFNLFFGLGGLLVSCLTYNHPSVICYTSQNNDYTDYFPNYFFESYFYKDLNEFQKRIFTELTNH
jgi:hypothetical protein